SAQSVSLIGLSDRPTGTTGRAVCMTYGQPSGSGGTRTFAPTDRARSRARSVGALVSRDPLRGTAGSPIATIALLVERHRVDSRGPGASFAWNGQSEYCGPNQ